MKLYTQNKKVITIDDKPFAKGGQGGIHSIVSPVSSPVCVAKMYLSTKKAAEVEKRIVYMINNNPFASAQQMISDSFAWPLEALYNDTDEFVGFTMRLISDSKTLWKMTIPKGFNEQKWEKFNISKKDSYNKRLKVLYNACQALNELDKSGIYRVVDLKPQNMMLTNNAHIKIIDCDSFQIAQNNQVNFYAEAATEEYCPPEFHQGKIKFRKQFVHKSWDYFSFAVSAYQVLFCIHPFNASHPKYHMQSELIKNGNFVHGSKKHELIKIPIAHKNFDLLTSDSLKNLFIKALDQGHSSPSLRPDFEQWKKAFLDEIHKLNNIPKTTGGIQLTFKPKRQKPRQRFKKNVPPNNIPVYGAVLHQFSLSYGTYSAILNWDISNAATVYLNNKQVSLKGSQKVPRLDKVYSLLIFDNNGISKTFQKKIKAPLNVSIIPVTLLNNPKKTKIRIYKLNHINSLKNVYSVGYIHEVSMMNLPSQTLVKSNSIDLTMTKSIFQSIEIPVKLNKPITKINTTQRKSRTFVSFYKAAVLAILFISKILAYKF